ncbi:MAG: sporulation integral membrane protein YtvI [Sarcina sp.]
MIVEEKVEKRKNFIINFVYFFLITIIGFLIVKYGINYSMPFIIGFAIAFILKHPINFIASKLHMNKKITAIFVILVFYCTVGTVIFFLGTKLVAESKEIFEQFPMIYKTYLEPYVYEIGENIETFFVNLDPSTMQTIEEVIASFSKSIGDIVSKFSSGLITFFTSFISGVPTFGINLIFSIMASVFFAMDYDTVTSFVMRQFSEKTRPIILEARNYMVGTLFNFIKAYSIIMGLTFVELAIGLAFFGVENFLTVAALISIFDVLPFLGTGGVVIPWIIIEFIKGNSFFAVQLTLLYILITVVRNIIEPKIVGGQIGLSPLIILMCMFFGVKLFGFIGMFILPIIIIILKNLNDSGKIKIFK